MRPAFRTCCSRMKASSNPDEARRLHQALLAALAEPFSRKPYPRRARHGSASASPPMPSRALQRDEARLGAPPPSVSSLITNLWRDKGFIPMFRHLLQEENITPARCSRFRRRRARGFGPNLPPPRRAPAPAEPLHGAAAQPHSAPGVVRRPAQRAKPVWRQCFELRARTR